MDDFKTAQAISCMELLRLKNKPNTDFYVCVWFILTINYLKKLRVEMDNPRTVCSVLSREWVDMVLKTYEDVYCEVLSELGVTNSEVEAKVGQCLTDLDLVVFMEKTVSNAKSTFGDEDFATKLSWWTLEDSLVAMKEAKNLEEKMDAIGKVKRKL